MMKAYGLLIFEVGERVYTSKGTLIENPLGMLILNRKMSRKEFKEGMIISIEFRHTNEITREIRNMKHLT